MRREELLGLRWRDMDLDKGWLTTSRRLGHSRPSTTTDLYGRLVPGADERAAGTIAARILGRKERPA